MLEAVWVSYMYFIKVLLTKLTKYTVIRFKWTNFPIFRFYSGLGWGAPCLLTLLVFILDVNLPSNSHFKVIH